MNESTELTSKTVAEWMFDKIKREKLLYQQDTVYEIESKFGGEFTYINENGNLAIDRRVLREFRNLTEDTVVWIGGERYWRFREDFDDPSKRQSE